MPKKYWEIDREYFEAYPEMKEYIRDTILEEIPAVILCWYLFNYHDAPSKTRVINFNNLSEAEESEFWNEYAGCMLLDRSPRGRLLYFPDKLSPIKSLNNVKGENNC